MFCTCPEHTNARRSGVRQASGAGDHEIGDAPRVLALEVPVLCRAPARDRLRRVLAACQLPLEAEVARGIDDHDQVEVAAQRRTRDEQPSTSTTPLARTVATSSLMRPASQS